MSPSKPDPFETDGFVRALLGAAAHEQPSPEGYLRTAEALGVFAICLPLGVPAAELGRTIGGASTQGALTKSGASTLGSGNPAPSATASTTTGATVAGPNATLLAGSSLTSSSLSALFLKSFVGSAVVGGLAVGGLQLAEKPVSRGGSTEAPVSAPKGAGPEVAAPLVRLVARESGSKPPGSTAVARQAPDPTRHEPDPSTATLAPSPELPPSHASASRLPRPQSRRESGHESVRPTERLTQELALLARARSALKAGRPRQALSLVSEHARLFPTGDLTLEREALQARALARTSASFRVEPEEDH